VVGTTVVGVVGCRAVVGPVDLKEVDALVVRYGVVCILVVDEETDVSVLVSGEVLLTTFIVVGNPVGLLWAITLATAHGYELHRRSV